MAKIKIDSSLLKRAKEAAKVVGYSSVEELITRAIEVELAKHEQADEVVLERLRGLGYIE